jgi:hypothetical protein
LSGTTAVGDNNNFTPEQNKRWDELEEEERLHANNGSVGSEASHTNEHMASVVPPPLTEDDKEYQKRSYQDLSSEFKRLCGRAVQLVPLMYNRLTLVDNLSHKEAVAKIYNDHRHLSGFSGRNIRRNLPSDNVTVPRRIRPSWPKNIITKDDDASRLSNTIQEQKRNALVSNNCEEAATSQLEETPTKKETTSFVGNSNPRYDEARASEPSSTSAIKPDFATLIGLQGETASPPGIGGIGQQQPVCKHCQDQAAIIKAQDAKIMELEEALAIRTHTSIKSADELMHRSIDSYRQFQFPVPFEQLRQHMVYPVNKTLPDTVWINGKFNYKTGKVVDIRIGRMTDTDATDASRMTPRMT